MREAIAHPARKESQKALEAGFSDLIRTNVDAAKAIYPQLLKARHLQGAAAQPFTRLMALGLAWDRRSDALGYFEQLGALKGDHKAQVWRIRSALWNGDWKHARQWIEALPAKHAKSPQWRYWLARADERLGQKDTAQTLYQSLTQGHGYYALLASWRLGVGYAPNTASLVNQPKLQKALISDTGVRRAHELFLAGLPSRAGLEWRVALGRASSAQRLQAVHLAHDWGWYSQSIATAARQGVFHAYDLLYPLPYPKAVAAAATAADLPEDWVYGVIRQESLYNRRAVSPSGAMGLMQLMPATADLVARRNDLPKPDGRNDLFDPRRNLTLGTKYLRTLLDRENGAFVVALAGYNAGASRAEHWLPSQPLAADVWIENIPYTETRHYIQRILWHVAIFGWERSDKPQNISALLAPVGPAG
ncbi:MAG: lytic transglycosylase domain-containing protein [Sinobacteraceae bacterium]|nr:lytic transglycosylase domain-containing protein [Nevskiaceae bacterium]